MSIELVEEGDEVKNDDEIHSVIEKENDKGKIQEQVSEKLDILDIGNLDIAFIEDKSREALVDNENIENKIGPEGDVRVEKIIKEKIEERNKKIEEEKGMRKK